MKSNKKVKSHLEISPKEELEIRLISKISALIKQKEISVKEAVKELNIRRSRFYYLSKKYNFKFNVYAQGIKFKRPLKGLKANEEKLIKNIMLFDPLAGPKGMSKLLHLTGVRVSEGSIGHYLRTNFLENRSDRILFSLRSVLSKDRQDQKSINYSKNRRTLDSYFHTKAIRWERSEEEEIRIMEEWNLFFGGSQERSEVRWILLKYGDQFQNSMGEILSCFKKIHEGLNQFSNFFDTNLFILRIFNNSISLKINDKTNCDKSISQSLHYEIARLNNISKAGKDIFILAQYFRKFNIYSEIENIRKWILSKAVKSLTKKEKKIFKYRKRSFHDFLGYENVGDRWHSNIPKFDLKLQIERARRQTRITGKRPKFWGPTKNRYNIFYGIEDEYDIPEKHKYTPNKNYRRYIISNTKELNQNADAWFKMFQAALNYIHLLPLHPIKTREDVLFDLIFDIGI